MGCEPNPDFNPNATDAVVDTGPTSGGDGVALTGGEPGEPLGEVCAPLGPPEGNVITVTPADADALNGIISSAAEGTTFLFESGTYAMSGGLWITNPGVTLRSATGNPEDVVLDGQRTAGTLIGAVASNITIAEMTLTRPSEHMIHTSGQEGVDVTGVVGYRLRLIDPGASAFKMNATYSGEPSDNGVVACSTITLTDAGRDELGVDCERASGVTGFAAVGWTVRDNHISGFWCPTGYAGAAVSFVESSGYNDIIRNVVVDSTVGLRYGVYEEPIGRRSIEHPTCADGLYDHYGGVIKDNFVAAVGTGIAASEVGFDSGIALWQVCDAAVVHNTVVSAIGSFGGIEYRFDRTTAKVLNNLTTEDILVRDDAGAPVAGNLEGVELNQFVNPLAGDLHLLDSSLAIDAGVSLGDDASLHDIDGEPRGDLPDVGADEHPG